MPPFTTLTTLVIPVSVIASLPIDMSSPNSTERLPSWPWVSTPPWVACKRERNTRLLHVNLWEKPAQNFMVSTLPKVGCTKGIQQWHTSRRWSRWDKDAKYIAFWCFTQPTATSWRLFHSVFRLFWGCDTVSGRNCTQIWRLLPHQSKTEI